MSLAGQSMPIGEPVNSTIGHEGVSSSEQPTPQAPRTSYRDSLPNAPRPPVYNEDDSFNANEAETMYGDYYDEMKGPSPEKKVAPTPQQAPALPVKSSLRRSRLLDSMALKIITNQAAQATPQEIYLSSEEDPSSSADEFSDYDYETDSAASADSPVRRSHEDTARVVSVVYAGKPSIIDLPSTKRSATPESVGCTSPTTVLASSSSAPSLRRMSTFAAGASESGVSSPPSSHPPRSSSMMINPKKASKSKPSFLSIDPCANKPSSDGRTREWQGEAERSEKPKTPTAQLFKMTLNIVRKRSRMQLKDMTAGNFSRDRLASPSTALPPVSAGSEGDDEVAREEGEAGNVPGSPSGSPSGAKKTWLTSGPSTPPGLSPSPTSSSPPSNTKSRLLSGFTNRRKSMRVG